MYVSFGESAKKCYNRKEIKPTFSGFVVFDSGVLVEIKEGVGNIRTE